MTAASRKAHLYSVHEHVSGGHGGNRRLAQVGSVLAGLGYDVQYKSVLSQSSGRTTLDAAANLLAGALPFDRATANRYGSLRGLHRIGHLRRMRIDDVQPGDVCAFDATMTLSAVLFERLRALRAVISVFPQNLDSLSPESIDPVSGARSPAWFGSEIAAIKKADLVCCISREEQWLLGLYGVKSHFLPYYPTSDIVEKLKEIRVARSRARKDMIVVFGTAANIPTYRGMEELIKFWAQDKAASSAGRMVVAGYGTQQLAALEAPGVSIVGTASEEQLRDLMIRARVCLIHQVPTTGCLTRVPELLIAGIPVVANSTGARTYHNMHGVLSYEQMSEIPSLLSAAEGVEPEMLGPPAAALASLAGALGNLAAGRSL